MKKLATGLLIAATTVGFASANPLDGLYVGGGVTASNTHFGIIASGQGVGTRPDKSTSAAGNVLIGYRLDVAGLKVGAEAHVHNQLGSSVATGAFEFSTGMLLGGRMSVGYPLGEQGLLFGHAGIASTEVIVEGGGDKLDNRVTLIQWGFGAEVDVASSIAVRLEYTQSSGETTFEVGSTKLKTPIIDNQVGLSALYKF